MNTQSLRSLGLLLPLAALSASAATISGEAPWREVDAAHHGSLDTMLELVANTTPPQQVRSSRSAEELTRALRDAGRFADLGLTTEEGGRLVEAVYRRFGLPLEGCRTGAPASASAVATAPSTPPAAETEVAFRAATEIEPLAGVLFRWPYDWAGMRIRYAEMISALTGSGATLYVWTDTQAQQDAAKSYLEGQGVSDEDVRWVIDDTQSVWIRDYGPNFLHEVGGDGWGVADFHYYNSRPADDDTPLFVADVSGVPVMNRQTGAHVVYTEGGNLNHDGLGTVVYSERTYNNNPGVSHDEIDRRIRGAFSASQSLVPQDPSLDGTGHVDMFTKIVSSTDILVAQYDSNERDYQVLEDAATLFAGAVNGAGEPWNVTRIWQPDVYYVFFIFPVVRTYTNSLIVNDEVILPVYNIPYDDTAISIYQSLLPGKTIHSVDARVIIESAGAWHCVTMEYADPSNPD
jgi:agmatine deiminase